PDFLLALAAVGPEVQRIVVGGLDGGVRVQLQSGISGFESNGDGGTACRGWSIIRGMNRGCVRKVYRRIPRPILPARRQRVSVDCQLAASQGRTAACAHHSQNHNDENRQMQENSGGAHMSVVLFAYS